MCYNKDSKWRNQDLMQPNKRVSIKKMSPLHLASSDHPVQNRSPPLILCLRTLLFLLSTCYNRELFLFTCSLTSGGLPHLSISSRKTGAMIWPEASHLVEQSSFWNGETMGRPDVLYAFLCLPVGCCMFTSTNLSLSVSLLVYLFGCTACEILIPQPGIEPGHMAVKVWSLNHRATRKSPFYLYF